MGIATSTMPLLVYDKRNLKYLKDVPWLDLVEEAWIENFERKMDEWLEKLVPIHKIGKAMKAEFINFGDDCMVEPDVKYAFDSDSDIDNMFENDGIVYVLIPKDCDEPDRYCLVVNSMKDRQALSWRNFFCSDLLEYFEQEGNILLTPYLDDRFNTNKPYSSVIDNISKEFQKMTGDKDVKICFSEGFYDMYL